MHTNSFTFPYFKNTNHKNTICYYNLQQKSNKNANHVHQHTYIHVQRSQPQFQELFKVLWNPLWQPLWRSIDRWLQADAPPSHYRRINSVPSILTCLCDWPAGMYHPYINTWKTHSHTLIRCFWHHIRRSHLSISP